MTLDRPIRTLSYLDNTANSVCGRGDGRKPFRTVIEALFGDGCDILI